MSGTENLQLLNAEFVIKKMSGQQRDWCWLTVLSQFSNVELDDYEEYKIIWFFTCIIACAYMYLHTNKYISREN